MSRAKKAIKKAKKKSSSRIQKVSRSSKTGRFVSSKFAKTHRSTTEVEKVKIKW